MRRVGACSLRKTDFDRKVETVVKAKNMETEKDGSEIATCAQPFDKKTSVRVRELQHNVCYEISVRFLVIKKGSRRRERCSGGG